MLILDFMKFEGPDFLAGLPVKPQRERSDSAGPGRLEGVSSSFRAHGKEGVLSASDECWMVHQDSRCALGYSLLLYHHVLLLVYPFLLILQHLRYDLGRFVVRRGLQMGCELWRQGLEVQI